MKLTYTTKREDLINALSEKTTVYDDCILETVSPSWTVGSTVWLYDDLYSGTLSEDEPKYIDSNGEEASEQFRGFYIDDSWHRYISEHALPVEFFNHQLLECDTSSILSVSEFIQTWGIPRLPSLNRADEIRLSKIDFSFDATKPARPLLALFEEAKEASDPYPRWYYDYCGEEHEMEEPENFVSLLEAALAISLLQVASFGLSVFTKNAREIESILGIKAPVYLFEGPRYTIRNDRHIPESRGEYSMLGAITEVVLEAFSTKRPIIRRRYPGERSVHIGTAFQRNDLSFAIANQMLNAIADEAPWRECACEGCAKVFKRKQTKKGSKPASDSVYCCDRCEERQKKRNQRKRRQAEKEGTNNG